MQDQCVNELERENKELKKAKEGIRVLQSNKFRYGARKIRQQMKANGIYIARCTIEPLMKYYGLQGG